MSDLSNSLQIIGVAQVVQGICFGLCGVPPTASGITVGGVVVVIGGCLLGIAALKQNREKHK